MYQRHVATAELGVRSLGPLRLTVNLRHDGALSLDVRAVDRVAHGLGPAGHLGAEPELVCVFAEEDRGRRTCEVGKQRLGANGEDFDRFQHRDLVGADRRLIRVERPLGELPREELEDEDVGAVGVGARSAVRFPDRSLG